MNSKEAALAVIKATRSTMPPDGYKSVLRELANVYSSAASFHDITSEAYTELNGIADLLIIASCQTAEEYITYWYGEDPEAAEWSHGQDQFALMLDAAGCV